MRDDRGAATLPAKHYMRQQGGMGPVYHLAGIKQLA
jgi:hypothetical protein